MIAVMTPTIGIVKLRICKAIAFGAIVMLAAAAGSLSAPAAPQKEPSDETQAVQPPADLDNWDALSSFFDGVMKEAMEEEKISGAVLALVKDGEIFLSQGYGHANRETGQMADPTLSVFRVGSLAKPFVGTAVLQLVEQGKLDLDADVNTYLAGFQIPETYPEPITLWHLLTHTAGFEERIIGKDRGRTDDEVRPLAVSLPDLMPARVRPPGEVASYSNWGVALAGHIVGLASGATFNDYVEQNIFAPLRMTKSTFREPLPAPLAQNMAVGYWHEDGAFVPLEFQILSDDGPAGALSSTATDMARFMIAHLQSGQLGDARILSEESAARMHRLQFGVHPSMSGMAISFGISTSHGRHILAHSGATMAFHAYMLLLPEEELGLFVAFNGPGAADKHVFKAFLDHYLPRSNTPAANPPEDFSIRSARYTGTYRNNRLAFTRLEKALRFDELTIHGTGRDTLFLGDLLSDPNNPDEGVELVEVEPNLFWNEDEGFYVAFSEDPSGEITGFHLAGSMPSFDRIGWYETLHALVLTLFISFLVFGVGSLRLAWIVISPHWHKTAARPGWVELEHAALLGMCVTGAAFAAGYPAMVLLDFDPFRYPPGTVIMLALPVICAASTVLAGGLILYSWITKYGSIGARLGSTLTVAVSIWFLFTLHLFNALGWRL